MSTLQEIELAIERLTEQEKAELRAWLAQGEAGHEVQGRRSTVRPAAIQGKLQWAAAFQRWIESNRNVTAVADDSRESIYAGRGE